MSARSYYDAKRATAGRFLSGYCGSNAHTHCRGGYNRLIEPQGWVPCICPCHTQDSEAVTSTPADTPVAVSDQTPAGEDAPSSPSNEVECLVTSPAGQAPVGQAAGVEPGTSSPALPDTWAITPGFYDDVPEDEYHRDRTSLSQSGAKLLLKAPALFRWEQDHPETSDAFDFGSAAHALALGQPLDSVYVAPFDNWQTKQSQIERKIAREDGLSPILPEQWLKVCDMAEVLSKHDLAMQLLTGGRSEVSAYAIDETTGVMRRCRFDHLHDDLGVDYKTSVTSDPTEFGRTAANFGYHQQDAWYRDIADDLGHRLRGFLFVVQMKEPPYLVSVCELNHDAVARGRELNQRALEIFRDCTESGRWPGYGGGIHSIALPAWAHYDKETA